MQINGNTPITLTLSVDAVNGILGALSTQPYERVVGTINTIQQQANQQVQALQKPTESVEEVPDAAT